MQSSGNSSPATPSANRSAAAPARKRFALAGPSRPIDPRVDAVRPDLADVRLADRVFAPHYAAPMLRQIGVTTILRAASAAGSESLATLEPGETFEALEFSGTSAWGIAPAHGLVGYVDAVALGAD